MGRNQNQKEKENDSGKNRVSPVAHFIILLVVALVTVTVMLALYRFDILENIWLWIIGLIGPIIAFIRRSLNSVISYLKKLEKK